MKAFLFAVMLLPATAGANCTTWSVLKPNGEFVVCTQCCTSDGMCQVTCI